MYTQHTLFPGVVALAIDSLIRLCVTDQVRDYVLSTDAMSAVLSIWPRATDVMQLSIMTLLIKLAEHQSLPTAMMNGPGLDILIALGNYWRRV